MGEKIKCNYAPSACEVREIATRKAYEDANRRGGPKISEWVAAFMGEYNEIVSEFGKYSTQ